MDHVQTVHLAPTDAELERAIVSVPGVTSALIDRSADTGKSLLRLRLAPGEDQRHVAWAVAATLRERFGIALDPEAIKPRTEPSDADRDPVRLVRGTDPSGGSDDVPAGSEDDDEAAVAGVSPGPARAGKDAGSPRSTQETVDAVEVAAGSSTDEVERSEQLPAAPGQPHPSGGSEVRVPRVRIRDLEIQRHGDGVDAIAVLEHDGSTATGHAHNLPTTRGTLRAVAEATVAALRTLAQGPLLVGIDRIVVEEHEDEDPAAMVGVSLVTRSGEERLMGASLVRDDPERAVMRATLGALNRRVTPLLADRGRRADPSEPA